MKVGILGGAFDPPHYAHLILAQEAYEQFGLDRVEFMPSFRPHHKNSQAYDHRHVMTAMAVGSDSRFQTNGTEKMLGTSYTVQVLDYLKDRNPDNEYTLIVGGDQASKFFTWMEPLKILKLARIVCSERALYNRGRIVDAWGDAQDLIEFIEAPLLDLSSSLIRERVQLEQSIQYLVPEVVRQYIHDTGLYR